MLTLGTTFYLNLLSAFFILASAAIPILLSTQLSGKVRNLTLILTAFIIVHGAYHIAVMFGLEFVGAGILDPLSVIILLVFGVSYLGLIQRYETSKQVRKKI